MTHWMKTLQNAAWLTQLGISLTAPPILCALGWNWMVEHWQAPAWGMVIALLVGLGASAASALGFWQMMQRRARKEQAQAPTAFNRHT
ncbi:AtpZ/AtpI family protein [uncultured Allofournierella sp.]|uniref:AtpZ/AtpI family protein n=1 Tax=uncultured Allofournierella sp. TaxID=1940258 RepID=UPI003752BD9A